MSDLFMRSLQSLSRTAAVERFDCFRNRVSKGSTVHVGPKRGPCGFLITDAMPPALTRLRERRFHRGNPGKCRRHSSRQSYPNQS